jgi:hypothetical protein
MSYYNEQQISQARDMDLLTYLRCHDPTELVHVSGNTYCTRAHDSLKISNGKWMWWSRGIGGVSALDYLIKVKGYSFTEAVGMILGMEVTKPPFLVPEIKKDRTRKLLLPKKNKDDDQVIRYLESRGIDRELIDECISRGTIYESLPHHNCIFVGFDRDGTAKYASFRATKKERIMGDAAGSNKGYSFRIEGKGNTVHVFESAIDLLSYATLAKIKTGREPADHLLSLAGVYQPSVDPKHSKVPIALNNFLESHGEVTDIALHLDSDWTGQAASKALTEILGKSYRVRDEPPKYGKDYNDELLHFLRQLERERSERSKENER